MQYLGGKARLAKTIAPILSEALFTKDVFVEPFVGGFNLIPSMRIEAAICRDIHPALIGMYRALQGGWLPPEELSETEYAALRARNDPANPLTAFAAFGCSFGGKEWGGYARNTRGDNYAKRAARSLMAKVPSMRGVTFEVGDYRTLLPSRAVIYADPPYLGTTSYRSGTVDHLEFYEWCERAAAAGNAVYVSEFTVPERDGWRVVADVQRRTSLRRGDGAVQHDYLIEVSA